MCLSKLWFKLDPTKCSGTVEKLSEITCEAATLLKKHYSFSKEDPSSVSTRTLILNRLTPFKIDPSKLSGIEICKYHKVQKCHANKVDII